MFNVAGRAFWRTLTSSVIKKQLKNEAIKIPQVLLIDAEGQKQGVLQVNSVLSGLDRAKFDLVLVNDSPPVARILPRQQVQLKQQMSADLRMIQRLKNREKEVRFSTNMAKADLDLRMSRVVDFLEKAYRVRVYITEPKSRQKYLPEARNRMLETLMISLKEKFKADLATVIAPESFKGGVVTTLHCISAKPALIKLKEKDSDDDSD